MHNYTIHKNGSNVGPLTLEQAKAGLADGTFAASDLAWRPGVPQWAPLAQRLAEDCGEAPPLVPFRTYAATPARVKPFSWLIPAILSTLFCCWPLGIVAIIFAVKAMNNESSGNYAAADEAGRMAKGFTLGTLAIGFLVVLAYFVFIAIAVASAPR